MPTIIASQYKGPSNTNDATVIVQSVDFYNFTTNEDTHIALRSLNADKEHQGGVLIEWKATE